MEREGGGALFGRSGQGVERGRSADVADERRLGGCELLRDRSDRFVWHAEQDSGSAGDGPRSSRATSRASIPERSAAAASDRPTRPRPTMKSARQGGGEVIPFQFPHRRYQTAQLVRTRWRGFGASGPRQSGRGPRRSIESVPGHPASPIARTSRNPPHSAHSGTFGAICERKPRPDGRGTELPSTWCRSTSSSASRVVIASRSWWGPMSAERPTTSPARSAVRLRSSASSRPHTRRCSVR